MKTDLLNMQQIFWSKEYDFEFSGQPQYILDLGAYAGYAAVYFANRFPSAKIVCVEPSPTNFRLLRMNTEPYDNVKCIHGAVWYRSTRLKMTERIGGDWGSVFGEGGDSSDDSVPAYAVPDILQLAGWQYADYIKCDIEGAEMELFGDTVAVNDWLSGAYCVSVETHDRFKPGCTEVVKAAMPENKYKHTQHGEFHIFTRRVDCTPAGLNCSSSAARMPLMSRLPWPRRFDRVNIIPEPWGFYEIDTETFQLHPQPPERGRAEIWFHMDLLGQRGLSARCSLPARSEWPVMFSVSLMRNGQVEFDEAKAVLPGEVLELRFEFPAKVGAYRLGLGTEMAPGARSNGHAWARWTNLWLE
jgi:FkbM family methyltransferase